MNVANRFGKIQIDLDFKPTQMIALLSLPDAEETEKFIEQKAAPEVKAAVKSGGKVCKSAAKNLIKL